MDNELTSRPDSIMDTEPTTLPDSAMDTKPTNLPDFPSTSQEPVSRRTRSRTLSDNSNAVWKRERRSRETSQESESRLRMDWERKKEKRASMSEEEKAEMKYKKRVWMKKKRNEVAKTHDTSSVANPNYLGSMRCVCKNCNARFFQDKMAVPYRLKKAFLNLLLTISAAYFYTIRFVFWLVNTFFRERVYVTPPTDRLLLISATQAVQMISQKEISSTALVESYIHRIEQVNNTINAVVVKLFESAREQANEVDSFIALADEDDIKKKLEEKPLYGVPFTMKDALEVENEIITCGVFNRKSTKCDRTAEAIKRLQAAGGILLAITNVPEVCMWVESVNTIYGRSKNPYDARRMTGGSSGGEGALLGSGGSVIGVGSDIGGSIRMPAFFNGVFGLKPTPGVIPLIGHVPEPTGYKTHMLRIGPMCRFAEDLPLMLRIMAGENAQSLNLHEPVSGKKLRVFYMEGITGSPIIQPLEDEMRYALKKAVRFLERKYDIIAQGIELPSAKHAMEFFTLSMHEDTTDPAFNKLMLCTKGTKGEVNCFTEIFKYMAGNSNHTLSGIVAGIIDSRDPPFSEAHTKNLLYKRDRLKRQVKELLGTDGILLFPSWPCTAMYHNEPILAPFNFCYTALWNVLSVPVVQCPLGLDSRGLPLGVQVIGNQYTDRNLIAIAQVLEEGFNGWTPAGPL